MKKLSTHNTISFRDLMRKRKEYLKEKKLNQLTCGT